MAQAHGGNPLGIRFRDFRASAYFTTLTICETVKVKRGNHIEGFPPLSSWKNQMGKQNRVI